MLRRILILDAVLIALIAVGANSIYRDWREYDATHNAELVEPSAEQFTSPAVPPPFAPPAPADLTEVSSLNLFSFDRSDVTLVAPEAPKVPAGPKPILFGTMSIGSERMAMLAAGQGGNRNYRPMRVGEVVDGWEVIEIGEKSVVVGSNEVRETVVINDPTAQVPRQVRRTVGAGAAPSVSTVAPSGAPPPSAGARSPSTANAAANPAPAAGVPRTRIIRTPFGDKVEIIDEP